jgi:hypothetical protein
MRLRWAAAGMIAAQSQYRRVKGYQQMPTLTAAIAAATRTDNNDQLAVAS